MLDQIITIVKEAGEIVLQAGDISAHTHEKSAINDQVTDYDVAVEEKLKRDLLALIPDAVFYGEEEALTRDPNCGWAFIVDPIDGTTNFIRDMHHSAISVALAKGGRVEYGVVYDPAKDEMFSAKRGAGACLNGHLISVSANDPSHALVTVGSSPYYRDEFADSTFRIMRHLFDHSMDFRRLASAALDLCYVACGRVEMYFEQKLSPWDYAAGSLIAEEAGGFTADLDGEPLPITVPSSVWASNQACRHMLADVKRLK